MEKPKLFNENVKVPSGDKLHTPDDLAAAVEGIKKTIAENQLSELVNSTTNASKKKAALMEAKKASGPKQIHSPWRSVVASPESNSSGRREAGRNRFNETLREVVAIEGVKNQEVFSRISVPADGDSIKNQHIDVISEKDKIVFTFKLTKPKWLELIKTLKNNPSIISDKITYGHEGEQIYFASSLELIFGKLKLSVAKDEEYNNRRSSYGLVKIELDKGQVDSADLIGEEIIHQLENVLESIVGVKDALVAPDAEAERIYKLNRYKWSHVLPKNRIFSTQEEGEILSRLRSVEVAPGYTTFVEDGRAEKMMEQSPFFLFHNVRGGLASVQKMIKTGALISTHERYRLGMYISGTSSESDIVTGGADGVFIRMWSNLLDRFNSANLSLGDFGLIFAPTILNRTDYYCYPEDRFGQTRPEVFKERITAEELLKTQRRIGHICHNELVFRQGIAVSDVSFITTRSDTDRENLLYSLQNSGITHIGERTLEEAVILWDGKPMSILDKIDPEIKSKLRSILIKENIQKIYDLFNDLKKFLAKGMFTKGKII